MRLTWRPSALRIVPASSRSESLRGSACGVAILLLAASTIGLGGCYEHVTSAGITSTEVRTRHEPNVEEEGPSWLNELMWGEPPKGEDPVKYYRRKNSLGFQE